MTKTTKTVDIDVQRQIIQAAQKLMKEYGLMGEIALKNTTPKDVLTGVKLEVKEMVYKPVRLTINTAITAGYFGNTAKPINFLSGAETLAIGQVIEFQAKNRTSKGNLNIIVESIPNDTTANVILVGGDNTITLDIGDFAIGKAVALEEGFETKDRGGIAIPRNIYNHSQIIRVSKMISGSLAETNNWDFDRIKEELIKQMILEFSNQLNGLATSYNRKSITIGTKTIKISGGMPFFMENEFNEETGEVIPGKVPDNVLDTKGAEMSLDLFNIAFKHVVDNGGTINAVRCGSTQAMKLSKLENAKVNIQLIQGAGTIPSTVGGAIQVLESPIKVGKNTIRAIYVDTSMPSDELEVFNDTKQKLIPKQNRGIASFEILHPTSDNDNYIGRMHGEWTFYPENIRENSFKFKKLSTTLPTDSITTP